MPIFYPTRTFGRFGLTPAVTYSLIHRRYGFDLGERYHRDIRYRIETTMAIDRAVYEDFHAIGLGYEQPFPRCSIEPFGHRFLPAMYGSQTHYSGGEEPAAVRKVFSTEEIERLEPWTLQRFENAEPVREVLAQAQHVFRLCNAAKLRSRLEYNPHYTPLSSLQNLGSAINTAVSAYGEDILVLYATDPLLLQRLYRNILELTLLCLDYFPKFDRRKLEHVFIGNCYVALISPDHYRRCNQSFDRSIAEYARGIGAQFLLHQDSEVTPHLENYSRLGAVHMLDVGQDTDFQRLHELFPGCRVNCILFPSWLQFHSPEDMREELERIMRLGLLFPSFSFSVLEIDPGLAEGRIYELFEAFRECAERVSRA